MTESAHRTKWLWLTATLVIAFALRVYGLRWGVPNQQHLHSYHPDEFDIATRAAVMLARGDLNPHFFNYGSLTIYLTYLAGAVAAALGFLNDWGGWHLISRLITVVFGTATVYVVFLIGKTLYDEVTGLVAAGFLAVMPGHAVHSHYATVDVPATFFISLSLLCAAKILSSPSWRWYALAGVSAGWAAACKYNAAVVLLSTFAAHVIRRGYRLWVLGSGEGEAQNPKPKTQNLLLALLAAVLAFALACPFALLDFPKFQHDFLYEWEHVHRGHGHIFEGTGNGFWYHLTTNLPLAVTVPLLVLSLIGFIGSLWERKPRGFVLAACVVLYYFLIGSVQVRFLRYTLPLAPILALYAAQSVNSLRGQPWRRALSAVVWGYAFLYTVAHVAVFARPDPRDAAAEWMQQHAPHGASVGLLNVPWFYTPPLTPCNGGGKTKPQFEAARSEWNYQFVITNWNVPTLRRERPQYFVLSEFEYVEEQRLRLKDPLKFLRELNERYALMQTFRNEPRLWGWNFRPHWTPHDWLYPFPQIKVFRLKTFSGGAGH